MNLPCILAAALVTQFSSPAEQPAPQPEPASSQSLRREPLPAGPAPLKAHGFGRPQQLFIGGNAAFNLGGEHQTFENASQDTFEFGIGANLGYFINTYLAPGAFLKVAVANGGGTTSATFAIGPSLAMHLRITEAISFLPTLGIGYYMVHQSQAASQTFNAAIIDFNLPFVFELGTGLALTLGPDVSVAPGTLSFGNLSESVTDVTYGLRAGLLGWL